MIGVLIARRLRSWKPRGFGQPPAALGRSSGVCAKGPSFPDLRVPFWETGPNRRQASDSEGKPPPYPGGEGVCTGPDFPSQSNLIARSEVPIAMCPVFNQDAAAAM